MLRLINRLQLNIKRISSIVVIVVPTLTSCLRRDTKQDEKTACIRVNQMFHRYQRRDRHSVSTSDAAIQPSPDATGLPRRPLTRNPPETHTYTQPFITPQTEESRLLLSAQHVQGRRSPRITRHEAIKRTGRWRKLQGAMRDTTAEVLPQRA